MRRSTDRSGWFLGYCEPTLSLSISIIARISWAAFASFQYLSPTFNGIVDIPGEPEKSSHF